MGAAPKLTSVLFNERCKFFKAGPTTALECDRLPLLPLHKQLDNWYVSLWEVLAWQLIFINSDGCLRVPQQAYVMKTIPEAPNPTIQFL